MKKYYTVGYRCTNCRYSLILEIPFGVSAPVNFTCPNCGTFSQERNRLVSLSEKWYRWINETLKPT